MSIKYFFCCNAPDIELDDTMETWYEEIDTAISVTNNFYFLLENISIFEAYFNINLKPISDCLNFDYWEQGNILPYFDWYKEKNDLDVFWERLYQQTYVYSNINSIKLCLIELIAKIKPERDNIKLITIINATSVQDDTKFNRFKFNICRNCPSIEDCKICLKQQKCQYLFYDYEHYYYKNYYYNIQMFFNELEEYLKFVIKAQKNNATIIYSSSS
jgi:hypothetical protein